MERKNDAQILRFGCLIHKNENIMEKFLNQNGRYERDMV